MARKSAQPLPPPPFVWGPSEINRWIEGAFPSDKRTLKKPRRPVRPIEGLRIRCRARERADVRRNLAEALRRAGFPSVEGSGNVLVARSAGAVRAVARIRSTLRPRGYTASIRFHPAVRPDAVRKIVALLQERIEVIAASVRPAR